MIPSYITGEDLVRMCFPDLQAMSHAQKVLNREKKIVLIQFLSAGSKAANTFLTLYEKIKQNKSEIYL